MLPVPAAPSAPSAAPTTLPFVQPEADDDRVWESVLHANPELRADALSRWPELRAWAFGELIRLLRAESPAYDEPGPPPPIDPEACPPDKIPLPGTPEKVALMVWRVRGNPLKYPQFSAFHPKESDDEHYARLVRVLRNGALQVVQTVNEADHHDDLEDTPDDTTSWQEDLQTWRAQKAA